MRIVSVSREPHGSACEQSSSLLDCRRGGNNILCVPHAHIHSRVLGKDLWCELDDVVTDLCPDIMFLHFTSNSMCSTGAMQAMFFPH